VVSAEGRPAAETRPARLSRTDFGHFRPVATRWADNDIYGHVNNVIYYSWFDTAVNGWLMDQGLLDPANSPVIALVVETGCAYFESVSFPDMVEIGLGLERLGRSSVTYRLGVFRPSAEFAAAQGRFTHVHVDRESRRPVAIPERSRLAMAALAGQDASR
jgi:acyl-CoA thioester hydrolase